jgi:site-specific recombinase XerD
MEDRFGGVRNMTATNKGKKCSAEPLTPDEVALLIAQCSRTSATGIRNRAMLTLAYRSGLRISELLAPC